MQSVPLLDCAGRPRSPATLASLHGRAPRTKGLRYPPDPPTVEEIVAVMNAAGQRPDGLRLRGLIIVLWRAGLRISEALALVETDLDPSRRAILVRLDKGGKRREVGIDRGPGSNSSHGSNTARRCRPAPCSVFSAVRRAGGHARTRG